LNRGGKIVCGRAAATNIGLAFRAWTTRAETSFATSESSGSCRFFFAVAD